MKFKHYCILALLTQLSIQFTCPGESSVRPTCTTTCNIGFCYVDSPDKTEGRCCTQLDKFCTATNMHTFHSKSGNLYQFKWSDHLQFSGYYKDINTNAACPIPYAFETYQHKRDVPVGFTTNLTTALSRCARNAQCASGYCGIPANPSFDMSSGSDRFCYKDPIDDGGIIAYTNPTEFGLKMCETQSDCPEDAFCYKIGGSAKFQAFDGSKIATWNGICAIAKMCPNPGGFTTSAGAFLPGRKSCNGDTDCEKDSKYKSDLYSSSCIPVRSNSTIKVCCYQPRKCSLGMMGIPRKNCKTTADCSVDGTSWCDSQGFCCRNENGTAVMCPDGFTLAANEPSCSRTKLDLDISSGVCDSNVNAKCYSGFCCPTLIKSANEYILGAFTYVTKMPCTAGKMVPQAFSYCLDGKISVLGMDVIKDSFERYKPCTSQADCSKGNPCVQGNNSTRCVPIAPDKIASTGYRFPLFEIILVICAFVMGVTARYVIKSKFAKKVYTYCCSSQNNNNRRRERDLEANINGAKGKIKCSPKDRKATANTVAVSNNNAPSPIVKRDNEAQKETSKVSTSNETTKTSTSTQTTKESTPTETTKASTPTSKDTKSTPKEAGKGGQSNDTQAIIVTTQPRLVNEATTKTLKKLVNHNFLFPKLDECYFEEPYFHGHIPLELIELREKSEWVLYEKLYYDEDGRKCVKLMIAMCRSDQKLSHYEIKVSEDGACCLIEPSGCTFKIGSLKALLEFLRNRGIPSNGKKIGKLVHRPSWVINHSKVEVFFKKQLGAGAFGAVYKGRMEGVDVAIKTVCQDSDAKDKVKDEELKIKMLTEEIMIACRLEHPNIVQTFGMVVSSSPVFAVLEFCGGGDFESFLKKGLNISVGELGCLALDVMCGLVYLHEHNVLHNDLATRNCLIDIYGRIKLADFGLSIKLKRGQNEIKHDIKRLHVPIRLMAPETLQKGGIAVFSRKSDIWGAGSLLFEIFNKGVGLWPDDLNNQRIATKIRKLNMPYDDFKGPREIDSLLHSIWQPEPKDRPSAKTICKLIKEFLKGVEVPNPKDFVINKIGVNRSLKDQDITEETSIMKSSAKTQNEEENSKQTSKKA